MITDGEHEGEYKPVHKLSLDSGTDSTAECQPRRRALRLLGRLGLGMVASAAVLARNVGTAAALYPYACCLLANPHSSNCYCASGTMYSWSCCTGSRLYQCIECWDTKYWQPSDCWSGFFRCSRAVNLLTRCTASW